MSLKRRFIKLLPILIALALWELSSLLVGTGKLPHLNKVLFVMFDSLLKNDIIQSQGGGDGGFSNHIVSTFKIYTIGFLGGAVIGWSLALVLSTSKTILLVADTLFEVFRVIPPLIIVPYFLLAFGPISKSHYLIVIIYTTLAVFIYTLNALNNINYNLVKLCEVYETSWFHRTFLVKGRLVLPSLTGGLRITSGITLGILIVGEYLGSKSGLGKILKSFGQFSRIDLIIVTIIWCVLIALLIDTLILFLFKRLNNWTDRDSISKLS